VRRTSSKKNEENILTKRRWLIDTRKIVHADVLTNVSLLLKKKKKLILSNAIMGLYWGGGR